MKWKDQLSLQSESDVTGGNSSCFDEIKGNFTWRLSIWLQRQCLLWAKFQDVRAIRQGNLADELTQYSLICHRYDSGGGASVLTSYDSCHCICLKSTVGLSRFTEHAFKCYSAKQTKRVHFATFQFLLLNIRLQVLKFL